MDNFYNQCPPMMSDGRHFTDYKTATRRNEYIRYINNIVRDDQYRLFLQQNGEDIMDNVWDFHKKNTNCWANNCVHNYPTRVIPRQLAEERLAHDKDFSVDMGNVNNRNPNISTCHKYHDYRASN
jgi:hypothetical protein